nr:MAG TPA: hypothetical protein [Caudoviricetes sp.]
MLYIVTNTPHTPLNNALKHGLVTLPKNFSFYFFCFQNFLVLDVHSERSVKMLKKSNNIVMNIYPT